MDENGRELPYQDVQILKFKFQRKMKALTKTDFHFNGQKSV